MRSSDWSSDVCSSDLAGVVEAVGAAAGDIQVGDRIAYAGIPGAYAATRVLPAWRAIKLPGDIGTKTAAVSFLRGMTAHMLLTRVYPVGSGTVLLVHAAAGGLGATLTRWATHLDRQSTRLNSSHYCASC